MDRSELWHFLVSLGLCTGIALFIIAIIHRRFQTMMVDLCEGEDRARFWTPAIEAWFFLSSVTAALAWKPDGLDERQLFLSSVHQVKSGLNGMSNAIILFSAGLIVFVLIRRFKGREQGEPHTEAI